MSETTEVVLEIDGRDGYSSINILDLTILWVDLETGDVTFGKILYSTSYN